MRVVPAAPRQGDVAVVFVAGAGGARELEGTFGGRALHFFPYGEERAALAGIDLETKPGKVAWRIGAVNAQGAPEEASGWAAVKPRKFAEQRLALPKPMVDLDPEAERRASGEAARLRALYETITPERLWSGRFSRPVAGDRPGEGFGSRRIINGQPRMPHSGVDFAADRGTPVVAANRGRVALVGEFFFAGRLVVLDHGLGLYTLYYHLDRIDVPEGTMVERGEPLGAVGATGRATGPHLHWGAQLGLSRVDPLALLSVSIAD
ncbi:MAG TPA: M23 family metallopeptidase [Candidatus Methylomirabilis sp.]|nr:M23 family metallopeptidase [Candidatus Methylomirabilis sp.]